MGFGGFFNYDKPGPGIRKDQPKKKAFFTFFEIWFRNFWKLIPVSLIYSGIRLLAVPSGLAEAGMANVARNIALDKHSFGLSDFFSTIKKNWKQALPAGIINTAITALMILAIWFYFFTVEGIFATIGLGLVVACFIVFSFMKYYVWLLIITFKLPLSKIYKNCFLFAFVNLKRNILIGLVWLISYAAVILLALAVPYAIVWLILLFAAVCVLPGFINLLIQFNIFPTVKKFMLDPYYEEHKGEDIELRRSLGLDIDEGEEKPEESVFDDNRFFGENAEK